MVAIKVIHGHAWFADTYVVQFTPVYATAPPRPLSMSKTPNTPMAMADRFHLIRADRISLSLFRVVVIWLDPWLITIMEAEFFPMSPRSSHKTQLDTYPSPCPGLPFLSCIQALVNTKCSSVSFKKLTVHFQKFGCSLRSVLTSDADRML